MNTLSKSLQSFLERSQDELVSLLFRLCEIPAPSHHEEQRAAFCLDWLQKNGADDAVIDDAMNVVWPYNADDGRPLLVVEAHTDTVFPDEKPFAVRIENNRAYCPAIGDDTANLAELMMLMKYCLQEKPATECGILFVLNSCEEGLGNLKGTRKIFEDWGSRVREFVSLDGGYDGVCMKAVGSHRYRIALDTEGGHSFGAFGNRNAIERMARLIEKLYAVRMPELPGARTTYNVGGISGGTSVNTIAQHAEILYEYRSDSPDGLSTMQGEFERIIEECRPDCLSLSVERLGERPCGIDIDPAREKALFDRIQSAVSAVTGQSIKAGSGSTDCNIPLSMGIPAACFGGYRGAGSHTYEEYIELDSLSAGWKVVALFLSGYFA